VLQLKGLAISVSLLFATFAGGAISVDSKGTWIAPELCKSRIGGGYWYTVRRGKKSAEMIEGEGDACWPSRKRVRNSLKRNGLNQTLGENIGTRERRLVA